MALKVTVLAWVTLVFKLFKVTVGFTLSAVDSGLVGGLPHAARAAVSSAVKGSSAFFITLLP
ncbi:hypothetical protein D3875_13790 [Deinococcus cavernae]|uniref:Uncharacterized protein n=1 Tax=Deinococcus cavernae TaxID=2320857 RepID=A0A418V8P0_9DEIO|nr:hypothetical protein D3875_13790 [Deinococcus cavernae]